MADGTIAIRMTVGGVTINNQTFTETADHPNPYQVSLPAGNAGTLSTRTDDTSGVLTVSSGHGIEGADEIDIYWSGGERYAVTVDSVTATTITFDNTPAASGDNLPVLDTAIVATKRVTINTQIDGDEMVLFGVHCDQRSQVTFYDSGDAVIKQYELDASHVTQNWYTSTGEANPLTGNPITYAEASNGSTTAATMKILSLEDSTP